VGGLVAGGVEHYVWLSVGDWLLPYVVELVSLLLPEDGSSGHGLAQVEAGDDCSWGRCFFNPWFWNDDGFLLRLPWWSLRINGDGSEGPRDAADLLRNPNVLEELFP